MLTTRDDWPADPAFAPAFASLSPERVLELARGQLVPESPHHRPQAWTACRVLEAMYDPGQHIRVVYALLDDETTTAQRCWPDGDLIYLRYPVRKPMSRRGTILSADGYDFEVYRFPNDRRLRGLRRFAQRSRAVGVWQAWLNEDESSLTLAPDTLRRRLLRYVPEQKWIVHLHAQCYDAVAQSDVKRAVAVRSGDPAHCKLVYDRMIALRRIRNSLDGFFRVLKPVALDTKLGLLATRWVWGQSFLEMLRTSNLKKLMKRVAVGLNAFHRAPAGDLPIRSASDSLADAVRSAGDIAAVLPAHKPMLEELIGKLSRRIPQPLSGPPCMVHNDFHWKQLRGRPDRLTLLDLERCCLGDPWVDVATFAAQLSFLAARSDESVTEKESSAWTKQFLDSWETVTGAPLDVPRLQWYSAVALLTLGRGMLRHLRRGWPTTVQRCVERAGRAIESRDDLEAPV